MPTLSVSSAALFGTIVLSFLWLDLHTHKGDPTVTAGSALKWSLLWMSLSLLFCGYLGMRYGSDKAWLFLTGYVLEQSLSVDNLFVFIAIFGSFALRDAHQHRVLYYGILGAIVLRFLFIGAGISLVFAGRMSETLHTAVFASFGLVVLWSGYQMYRALGSDSSEREDYTDHWSVRLTRRAFPIHPRLEGRAFFVREGGRLKATPLFLCLVTVEASDLAFAFDSVPAVIAVTREPFLVYSSNIFAILGLRSLYFLLAAARKYLCHLEKAVVAILAFVGCKLLIEAFQTPIARLLGRPLEISAGASLTVVLIVLTGGVAASILFPEREGRE
ncbi:MAG: TerC/Alx family metal homeostasis membrane protein [Polyangiales bacterium]